MPEFTPLQVVDRSKEKDWAYQLGLMDWDNTKIVFTKRSLIDFLKNVNVTVDTNFTQISKLPRYAEFGKMSGESSAPAANPTEAGAAPAVPERVPADPSDPDWKPTRRVRTAPGGAQTFSFGDNEPEQAAAYPPAAAPTPAAAPAPVAAPVHGPAPVVAPTQPAQSGSSDYRVVDNDGNAFKPTRRVRTAPGGKDSIGALFGGE